MSRLTLRQKIVFYCLIVLSPVVLLSYYLVGENYSYAKQTRLDSISARSALVQLSIDDLIDGTTRFLENLAQVSAVREKDKVASNKLFSTLLPLYPNFTNLATIDIDGQPLASVQRGSTLFSGIADRPYFQDLLRTGRPVVSGRLMGRATDQPVFAIAVPVRDDAGQISGALVAGVSLKQIRQNLERLGKESGSAIIVDADGAVLSHPNWSYVLEGTNLKSLAPVELALSGNSGTTEVSDPLDGENWLWSYRPVARAPWAIAVKYPGSFVYSPVHTTILTWILFPLGAIALAIVLASLTADRIARPLRRLTSRMVSAVPTVSAEGLHPPNQDELHQLTHIFNRVCSTLAQTSEELADVKGELAGQAKKLESLTHKAIQARDEERRRLAMDIHDGVLQLIVAAQGQAKMARSAASSYPDSVAVRLEQVESLLDHAMGELRGMARGVHPPALEGVGLVHAIYYHLIILKDLFKVPRLSLRVAGNPCRLHPEIEMAAFRIAQESLSNVGKHAKASAVEVFIDFNHGRLRLAIVDDGVGFNMRDRLSSLGAHCGLANMRERAEGVGGKCTVLSMPGEGTRIEVDIPLTDSLFNSPTFIASLESRIHGEN